MLDQGGRMYSIFTVKGDSHLVVVSNLKYIYLNEILTTSIALKIILRMKISFFSP